MRYIKARIKDEPATHRATEIQKLLMDTPEVIAALMQTPWFLALREINRRYECATYNEDGDPWIFIPAEGQTHDYQAVNKLAKLFPDILEIQPATAEEVAEVLALEE